jgi:hypothetical protein
VLGRGLARGLGPRACPSSCRRGTDTLESAKARGR